MSIKSIYITTGPSAWDLTKSEFFLNARKHIWYQRRLIYMVQRIVCDFSCSSSDKANNRYWTPPQRCNGYCARLECGISWVRSAIASKQHLWYYYIWFSIAVQAKFRSKSKDWLALCQNNVSEWSDMSTCELSC